MLDSGWGFPVVGAFLDSSPFARSVGRLGSAPVTTTIGSSSSVASAGLSPAVLGLLVLVGVGGSARLKAWKGVAASGTTGGVGISGLLGEEEAPGFCEEAVCREEVSSDGSAVDLPEAEEPAANHSSDFQLEDRFVPGRSDSASSTLDEPPEAAAEDEEEPEEAVEGVRGREGEAGEAGEAAPPEEVEVDRAGPEGAAPEDVAPDGGAPDEVEPDGVAPDEVERDGVVVEGEVVEPRELPARPGVFSFGSTADSAGTWVTGRVFSDR
ncbi:hypothetical protein [Sphaerisporangium flaviroseum]|uniref:hypothetical protein n=1 Tax=Sphaerisporangium flaviroseum TaxID=509199 RepID=UPI0031E83711